MIMTKKNIFLNSNKLILKKINNFSNVVLRNFSNFQIRKNKQISAPVYTDIEQIDNLRIKNSELIDSDYGLKQFIKKTYLWTGGGICSSIGIGILGSSIAPEIMANQSGLFAGVIILSFGGIFGISFCPYSINTKIINLTSYNLRKKINYQNTTNYQVTSNYQNQIKILDSINSSGRIISYGSLITGMGLCMIPACAIFPNAIIPAFIASSSVFGGSTLYALNKKQGELEPLGSALYGGLTGLVGVSLLGLGSNIFYGTNWFGDITHMLSLYGGIPLFTGLIAYDTDQAIKKYQSGDPDHLGTSVELYLDFLNLFVRFIEIIGKIQSSNKD